MKLRRYFLFETPFGICGLVWSESGLIRVLLPDEPSRLEARCHALGAEPAKDEAPSSIQGIIARLRAGFEGVAQDFSDVSLDWSGISEGERAIYSELRGIGWGRTTTYGALARAVGKPRAAQAVGIAMGRNPWPVIVPCHRVLGAGAYDGGFSAPGGVKTKTRLLALEGVTIGNQTPLLPGLFTDTAPDKA